MKTTCEFGGALSAYLDGELPAERREAVEKHLATCAACAGALAEMREDSALLAGWRPAVDPGVRRRLHAAVESSAARRGIERLAAGLGAVAAAVAIAGGLFLSRQPAVVETNVAAGAPWEAAVSIDETGSASREVALAEWVVHDLSQDTQRRPGHEEQ